MTIEEYVRHQHPPIDENRTDAERYYAPILRSISMTLPLSGDCRVLYTARRTCSTIILNGASYVLYDQYLGQTMNMFNRIHFNSQTPLDAQMYALKVIGEECQSLGNAVHAFCISQLYRAMWLRCDSYMRDLSFLERPQFTLAQECFIIVHEMFHNVIALNQLDNFFTRLEPDLREQFALLKEVYFQTQSGEQLLPYLNTNHLLGLLDASVWQHPAFSASRFARSSTPSAPPSSETSALHGYSSDSLEEECFCDVGSALLCAQMLERQFQVPLVTTLTAIFVGLHHLRLLLFLQELGRSIAGEGGGSKTDASMAHLRINNYRQIRDRLWPTTITTEFTESNERHTEILLDAILEGGFLDRMSVMMSVVHRDHPEIDSMDMDELNKRIAIAFRGR